MGQLRFFIVLLVILLVSCDKNSASGEQEATKTAKSDKPPAKTKSDEPPQTTTESTTKPKEPPKLPKNCSELTTQGQLACVKADAVAGKICVWEFEACTELSPLLKEFRKEDRAFKVTLPTGNLKSATDDALGLDHGELPDWSKLCGINNPTKKYDLYGTIISMSLSFKKDKKEVTLVMDLDCNPEGAKVATFNFSYDAKAVGDALLIKLDAGGQKVEGEFENKGRRGNLFDFFTKADWLYSKKQDAVIGISQLGKYGYRRGYPLLDLNDEDAFDAAITYARGPGAGYEIGKKDKQDIGAVSLIFKKI